jgi:hypothetical protein
MQFFRTSCQNQPILLSHVAAIMATWLDISRNSSEIFESDSRSSAIFLIKNKDSQVFELPPISQLPVAQSKLDAAKRILSAAASRVSSWVRRKARPMQAQGMQVLETPTASDLQQVESKRIPRSQRLAKQTERLDVAGTFALLTAPRRFHLYKCNYFQCA